MMDAEGWTTVDVTVLPLAVREAAFFESADCYTAMIANREVVSSLPSQGSLTVVMDLPYLAV